MKRAIAFVLALTVLVSIGLGCGGSQEKGINSGKDKPKPADKER